MKTFIVLEVETSTDVPDLADIAAGRIYTATGVNDVTARILDPEQVAVLKQIDAKRERNAYNAAIPFRYEPFTYTERS